MIQRGFTIVELIITISIMGILLVLAVVNVTATQVKARDDERATDIASIATHLESIYKTGVENATVYNTYPTLAATTWSEPTTRAIFRDADIKSFLAPGTTDPALSFVSAQNSTQTTAGVLPQPRIDQYVYQPLKSDGVLCSSGSAECRKYNLYYRLEENSEIKMVTSKNQ